jgi:hypothetical protein
MIGMEEHVSRLLDEADAWDHIVAVNSETAPRLARHPKLRPLKYRGGLYENRRDMDPAAVAAMLPKPGEMIIVDDPRVAAAALHRTYRPVPLPPALCIPLARETGVPAPAYEGTNFNLFAYSQSLGRLQAGEAFVVLTRDFPDAARPQDDTAQERARIEWIVQRAWAAQNVAPAWNSERLRLALRNVVRTRSLHSNWRFQGLDGAAAVRALARLKDTSTVPMLISTFRSVDPALSRVSNMAQFGDYPMSWHDAVFKMYIIPALGELPGVETKWFLLDYIDRTEADVRACAPPQWEEATKALLKQKLTAEELNGILTSSNSAVRGTAIVELLANKTGHEVLWKAAPWALKLPGPEK